MDLPPAVLRRLLDANVLIALVVADHDHHRRAPDRITGVDRFALRSVVAGALVRYLVRDTRCRVFSWSVMPAPH